MVEPIDKHADKVIVFAASDNSVVKVDITGFLIIAVAVFHFVEMAIKQRLHVGNFIITHTGTSSTNVS